MGNSATGGYLLEIGTPPQNGQELIRFLHDIIVGVTNISNELVRPMWQINPPPTPNIDVDWCSFGITLQVADANPALMQGIDEQILIRHEQLDVSCIFYGENSASNAEKLRDGLYLSQNRDVMTSVGMTVTGFGDVTHVPELINDRYFERNDIMMFLRREIKRNYPIFTFTSVETVINNN